MPGDTASGSQQPLENADPARNPDSRDIQVIRSLDDIAKLETEIDSYVVQIHFYKGAVESGIAAKLRANEVSQRLSYAATAHDHALVHWDKLKTMPIDNTLPPDQQTYLKERQDEALYKAAIKLDRFTKSRFRDIHTAMVEYVNEFSTNPEELMVDYTDRVKHHMGPEGKLLDLLKGTAAEGAKPEPVDAPEVKTGEKAKSRSAALKRRGADKAAPENG